MKRACIGLLLIGAAFILACTQPSSNGNGNANSKPDGQPAKLETFPAKINVVYVASTPPRVKIGDIEPINMLVGDKIEWDVNYTFLSTASPPNVTVIVKDFDSGSAKDPFGNGMPGDNQFNFGLSSSSPNGTQLSATANKLGTYKYSVFVQVAGVPVQWVLDPQVIISETRTR